MRYSREDSIKVRLTDRVQLVMAVEKLMEQGVAEELIPVQLTRFFYVDLDELKIALDTVRKLQSLRKADESEELRAVA